MNLKWEGQELVTAPRHAVWAFITDPYKIAECVPDLIESTVNTPQDFDAVVAVAVGPVRGKFKLKIALDHGAVLHGMGLKISGGGFGSVVDLVAGALLEDNGDYTTTLNWHGSAVMRGPVATVGGRVIDAQAQRVIRSTFENVKSRCSSSIE